MTHNIMDDDGNLQPLDDNQWKVFSDLCVDFLQDRDRSVHPLAGCEPGDRLRLTFLTGELTLKLLAWNEQEKISDNQSVLASVISRSGETEIATPEIEIVGSVEGRTSLFMEEDDCREGEVVEFADLLIRPISQILMHNYTGKIDKNRILSRNFGNYYRHSGRAVIIPCVVSLELTGHGNSDFADLVTLDLFNNRLNTRNPE